MRTQPDPYILREWDDKLFYGYSFNRVKLGQIVWVDGEAYKYVSDEVATELDVAIVWLEYAGEYELVEDNNKLAA